MGAGSAYSESPVGRCLVRTLLFGILLLPACARGTEPVTAKIEPAAVQPLEGSSLNSLVLTPKAVERLGITTEPVREVALPGVDESRKVVPYAAVIYDTQGATLMYRKSGAFSFVREPITVDRIEKDLAFLFDGPVAGAEVVTVGAAELFGIEFGIGK